MKSRCSVPSPLLATVASSAQMQTETAYLQQQNLKYMSLCSELEFKASELKATVEARSIEIEKLKVRNMWEGGKNPKNNPSGVKTIQELRTYQALLEHENSELRKTSSNPSELHRLLSELQQVRQLQQLYKDKLAELQEKSLDETFAPSKRSPLSPDSLLSLNHDLTVQLQATKSQLSSLNKERDYFRDTVVPVLKQTVELFDQHKANLLAEIEELEGKERTPEFGRSKELEEMKPSMQQGERLALVKGLTTNVNSPPPQPPTKLILSPRLGSSSVLQPKASANSSTRGSKTSVYSPSFLRVKRHGLKVKARRDLTTQGMAEEEEDAFADEFPEEDELEMRE